MDPAIGLFPVPGPEQTPTSAYQGWMRLTPVLLVLTAGCGATPPAPPTEAPRIAARTAPVDLGMDAPEATEALLEAVAQDRGLVIAFAGPGGPTCLPIEVHRSSEAPTWGSFEGIRRDEVTIALRLRVTGTTFQLDDPMLVRYGQQSHPHASLAGCDERYAITGANDRGIDTDRGTLYSGIDACQAALEAGLAGPFDLGGCGERLDAVAERARRDPAPADIPELRRVMQRHGRVFELASVDSPCGTWRFRRDPENEGPGYVSGHMITERRERGVHTITTYGYDYAGNELMLAGPSSETFENGRPAGSMGMMCASAQYVEAQEGYFAVGTARWYLTRAACEDARAALATQPPEEVAAIALGSNGC